MTKAANENTPSAGLAESGALMLAARTLVLAEAIAERPENAAEYVDRFRQLTGLDERETFVLVGVASSER